MIYYNFIRPYIGLDDGTPAEEAEIDLNRATTNGWLA